jgi:hypothetical protein
MEKRIFKPYFVVLILMVGTSLALAFSVDVSLTNEAGITLDLPETIGEWEGSQIKFCQGKEHQGVRNFRISDIDNPDICPHCGSSLENMSKSEADILPDDTGMLKMDYEHATGRKVNASIVMSGAERGSIHRPEQCLTGQGSNLVGSYVLDVPIEGRDPLPVMVLHLERQWKNEKGQAGKFGTYYAYWFVGKDRETPHHHMRMFWMAADRVMRNVSHRWAYISVSGQRDLQTDDHQDEIRQIVAELYPSMAVEKI